MSGATNFPGGPAHAFFAGAVVGIMKAAGLDAQPVTDDKGDFTADVDLTIPEWGTVRLYIPPPPGVTG